MDRKSKDALGGVKILDLSRVLSGPYCTMLLSDFGAEVIKIEKPISGDDSRYFGPFIKDESLYFMSINRNKQSMTLDLKSPEGKGIFRKLSESADVIVENFRAGTMNEWGLGYDCLKEKNPGLIYASITGFGQTGPYRDRAAYDGIIQAMSGLMSITGERGGQPVRVGASISDIIAGIFCSYSIALALLHKQRTGEGQFIDISMLDSQVAILENAMVKFLSTGIVPKPEGNQHTSIFPFEAFPTKNGSIMVAAGNNELWKKLCVSIELPELAEDERFSTNPLRQKNHDSMYPLLCNKIIEEPTEVWQQIFDRYGIPCSPVSKMDEVVKNPQLISRDMIVEIDHKVAGRLKFPGIPVKMSNTPGRINKAAPLLGENSREILENYLGMDSQEIEALYHKGII